MLQHQRRQRALPPKLLCVPACNRRLPRSCFQMLTSISLVEVLELWRHAHILMRADLRAAHDSKLREDTREVGRAHSCLYPKQRLSVPSIVSNACAMRPQRARGVAK